MKTSRTRNKLQSIKNLPLKYEKEEVELQSGKGMDAEKSTRSHRGSITERKMALQQDVDKLRKRLRHEENIHRALERAFTRPLGALPRLPPYLPATELVAEVAVLEEEVVRLEEKIVHFRQGLYQEAVYISSSKKNIKNSIDLCNPSQINDAKPKQSRSSHQTNLLDSSAIMSKNSPSLLDERKGKENQSSINSSKNKEHSSSLKVQSVRNLRKRTPVECKSAERCLNPQKLQLENQEMNHESSEERNLVTREEVSDVDNGPNKLSENILKCLMNIFMRMSSNKSRGNMGNTTMDSSSESFTHAELKDPYSICSEFGKRDVGPYKHLFSFEATSINPNRTTTISIFLIQRLKLLLQKLATVNLKGLAHQEKLAFWINIYNSCMMNAFLEYGIPDTPEMVVVLMQKASVNVGGHILNALTIEHFILRLPYHSKYTFSKDAKKDEAMTRSMFGLELSEPLVTYALSCGSWSSPAVRVYTASQVENELEAAKKDYLQASIGISTLQKVIAIPKLLDWYLLDFAKNIDSLLDWICLQLPYELGKEAIKCLERTKDETLLQSLHIMPYEFSFRYLLHGE